MHSIDSSHPSFAARHSHGQGRVACPDCDLLLEIASLSDGSRANCPRCNHTLTRYIDDGYNKVLAYSVGGLMLLVLASSYPFLSFAVAGLESEMTLIGTPGALWQYGMPGIGAIVAAFIIVLPGVMLLMTGAVASALLTGRNYPWLVPVARLIFHWQGWAMAEVFIIGVIVSLVKLATMASVVLGVSFYSYGGFTLCLILALSTLDRYRCWEDIEAVTRDA
ncbi:MAG: paraquat-inducible protein A [Halioglobus sp.]|nr:paraquat-inducible protein A [Halioglobus sp.]